MKEISIALLAGALTLCTARPAPAVMNEYATTNRVIAITNNAPASELRPLAAFVIFPSSSTGTLTCSRVSRSATVPLARHDFTNVSALAWFPPADFPIRRGEAFAVSSTVARFTLQLESNSDGNGVKRTDAPDWFDNGRACTAQAASGGGGSTIVIVSNTTQAVITNTTLVVVTNAPHITVSNATLVAVTNAPVIIVSNVVIVTGGGSGGGEPDNLGNHTATQNLDMATHDLTNVWNIDVHDFLDARGAFAVPQQNGEGTPYRGGQLFFDTAANLFKGYNGSQYVALGGPDNLGNGFATSDVDLQTYKLTASFDAGGYRVAQNLRIYGYPGGDSSGGTVEIKAGDGNSYTPGAVTITGGGGVTWGSPIAGAVVIEGGNGSGDSSGTGGAVSLRGGPGGTTGGEIVLHSGSGGATPGNIRLDFTAGGELNIDNGMENHNGATASITVKDGDGNNITLQFFKGLFIGTTGP